MSRGGTHAMTFSIRLGLLAAIVLCLGTRPALGNLQPRTNFSSEALHRKLSATSGTHEAKKDPDPIQDSLIHHLLELRQEIEDDLIDMRRHHQKDETFHLSHEIDQEDVFQILAVYQPNSLPNASADTEAGENDVFEETFEVPEMISDALLEEDLVRQPRKFTFHCTVFLILLLALFLLCKWASLKLQSSKSEESQLDLMVKRQILASAAFKNGLRHYEDNICVQYASEEEYLAVVRLKEQQRINLKARLERQRYERGLGSLHPSVIQECSNESASHDSLLLQSLSIDDDRSKLAKSNASLSSHRGASGKKKETSGRDSAKRTKKSKKNKRVPKEGPSNSLTSISQNSSMSFDRSQDQISCEHSMDLRAQRKSNERCDQSLPQITAHWMAAEAKGNLTEESSSCNDSGYRLGSHPEGSQKGSQVVSEGDISGQVIDVEINDLNREIHQKTQF